MFKDKLSLIMNNTYTLNDIVYKINNIIVILPINSYTQLTLHINKLSL